MKTSVFCSLIERSIIECYGAENASQFDRVPYMDDGSSETKLCLGIFLTEVVHMASVSAQAMLFIHQEFPADEQDTAMEDFVLLMQLFRVAPYMQWHCIYFPGLTDPDEEIQLDESLEVIQS